MAAQEVEAKLEVTRKHWFALLLLHVVLLQALAIATRIGMIYEAVALDIGTFWVGVIGGVFGLLPAFFALHIGRHLDRAGEKSGLVWGSAVNVVASAGLVLAPPSFATLILASLFMGFGQFLAIAGQQSAAARSASSGGGVQRFGWMTLFVALAQTVGPLIVGLFAAGKAVPDTGAIYLLGVVVNLVTLGVALLIYLPHSRKKTAPAGMLQGARQIVQTDGFVLATAVSLLIFAAMELLVIYLPVYGTEHAIDAATISVLLSIRGAASMLSRLFFGPALRLLGKKSFILLSLVLSGVSIGLLPVSTNLAAMGAMLFIAGFGLGVGAPLSLSWLAEIVAPEIRGSAYAVRLSANRIGQFLLPVAAGPVAGAAGTGAVLLAISASLLVGAAVVARRFRGATL